MENIKEDRNRCAHPTMNVIGDYYIPTAELARLHLRNAVSHVLSQPPVQGKAAIELVKRQLDSIYLPTTDEELEIFLRHTPLMGARQNLIDQVLRHYIQATLHALDPRSSRSNARLVCAIRRLHRDKSEIYFKRSANKIFAALPDDKLHFLLILICSVEDIWRFLDGSTQSRCKEFLLNSGDLFEHSYISQIGKIDELREMVQIRISTADEADLRKAIASGERSICLERSVELFRESGNWTEANQRFEYLISPLIGQLSMKHVESILKAPTILESDLKGSFGFSKFISEIRLRKNLPQDEITDIIEREKLSRYDDNPFGLVME